MKILGNLCFSVLFLYTVNLQAQVFYIPIDVLAKHSIDIVEGKVIEVEHKWDDDHRMIYTFTIIEVIKSFKNNISTAKIVLEEIGAGVG